jgi:outer membrane lipoprotein-sorting protein
MFMKTGRKNLVRVLFSPVRKPRFEIMSILLSTIFPLALSGSVLPAATAQPLLPAQAQPAKAHAAKPVPVKVTPPATKPAIAVAPPAPAASAPQTSAGQAPQGAQLIQIQQPSPSPAPQATAPAATDRAAIIDRVSKALSEVKTAQGKFTQVEAGGTSSGAFYISRPGKIRFEYTAPEPMFIISDGVSVSIEEPKRESYDAVPLSSTQFHLFLRSNVDLKRDGSVTDVTTSNGSHFVTLVDKTGEADGKMILEFRASDFELLGWRAINGTGGETRVKLTDVKKNVSIKPSLFVVQAPADRGDDRR